MAYREQLRQAREILKSEMEKLQGLLTEKERDLRKLENLLKKTETGQKRHPSLTSQIVEALYGLAEQSPEGVPARAVVREFARMRDDVNESTIRSTLYQVTRKAKPTEIAVGESIKRVRVSKNGPLYGVELVLQEPAEIL